MHEWETQRRSPDPRLRGLVHSYTGYVERTPAPLRRLEAATMTIPMILNLGPGMIVAGERFGSFVAGPIDGPTVTEHAGEQLGIEVNLTPLGARRLLGVPLAEIAHAWALLDAAHGCRPVAGLAREVGWSRRHLAARFKEDVGVSPKTAARILRFERVTTLLRRGRAGTLADAAYACGYADQAHLNRDFRAFAGTTPTDYAARVMPEGRGVAA